MDKAIRQYFDAEIKEKTKLCNGWKETWLLTLSNDQKVVFRAYKIIRNSLSARSSFMKP